MAYRNDLPSDTVTGDKTYTADQCVFECIQKTRKTN